MSDASEAVAEAVARNKRLAAGRMVRKAELEAEVLKLKGERAELDAQGGSADVDSLRSDLDARIAAGSAELALVAEEIKGALAEIAELKRLASKGEVNAVAALMAEDPVLRSPEQTALDNARAGLADLQARVGLAEELGELAPPAPAPSREEADAQALAKFQELRARREPDSEREPAPPPPKKTL